MRKVGKIFPKSPQKNVILQNFVKHHFKGKEFKLKLNCKTRWNSLFFMIFKTECVPKSLRDILSVEAILSR